MVCLGKHRPLCLLFGACEKMRPPQNSSHNLFQPTDQPHREQIQPVHIKSFPNTTMNHHSIIMNLSGEEPDDSCSKPSPKLTQDQCPTALKVHFRYNQ
ncbi:hypothetical protein NPIL_245701 [Nephila pilipes]|uniref:Uncharacterized protein n=1 Tax=Nephila pilipes TaxID=299642 RepID=A0A8X6TWI5_NEPPI|nr:hypothetical protein NPIL_245701 [Nephila pilipes]